MAEIIYKNFNSGNTVKSAGTHAADEMTSDSLRALKICGEKLPRKKMKATQFVSQMVSQFDFVICMTRRHKERVGDFPNVKTLDDYTGCGDVFDPYGWPLDTYVQVCKKLQNELRVLYNVLSNRGA